MPNVSVLMPVFNCAPFVVDAARSILTQDYSDLELLVVDDGSTDGTFDRLQSEVVDPRLVLIEGTENRGLPSRLNQLIRRSKGNFIARMDGDDISYPGRIRKQLAFLARNPEVDLVACSMVVIDNQSQLVGKNKFRGRDHGQLTATPWRGFHLNHGTWLAHRQFFERFPYDPGALLVEDEELLLRSFQTSRFAMLADVEYAYRVDTLSMRKILRTRLSYVRSVCSRAWTAREPLFLLSAPDQAAKAIAEAAVNRVGLGKRLLRHRFGALSPDEQSRWGAVAKYLTLQLAPEPDAKCGHFDVP